MKPRQSRLGPGTCVWWLGLMVSAWIAGQGSVGAVEPDDADGFFGLTNVWDVDLRLESAAWDAMEPTERVGMGPGPDRGQGGRPMLPEGPQPGGGQGPVRPGLQRWVFPWVQGEFQCGGQVLTNVGVRFKGNSSYNNSRGSLKRPLKLDFNRFVKGQKFHDLAQVNLSNNTLDPSQMREALACEVFRAAGLPAARTAFARVYLTVPGQHERAYLGLYTVIEEVDDRFIRRWFGTKKGLLLKPELPPGLVYLGESWEPYARAYDPQNEASSSEKRQLREFLRLIHQADDVTFRRDLERYLDVEQFLHFVAVNVAMANLDSYLLIGHNFYLHQPAADGRFRWIPWDLNHAFGGFPAAGTDREQADLSLRRPFSGENRLLERVLAVEAWNQGYLERFRQLLSGPFNPERVLENIRAVAGAIGPDAARDLTLSPERFEAAVFREARRSQLPESAVESSRGESPSPGRSGRGRMMGPTMPLEEWVRVRGQSIADQLAGRREGRPPAFRGPGGPGRPGPGPGGERPRDGGP